ncbi:protein CREG1-like [Phymastichus coffea]|uniref:protein CREG1-like n=1 Tax=Phymastichus coffea TaxID=108790 RepID=UPI00273C16FA|nr:protein CREG1-like [Phymastichus coffea]
MASSILLAILTVLVALTNAARLPPTSDQTALMARYIVNEAEWASIATVSVRNNSKDYPFVTLISASDGAVGQGTGVIYMLMSPYSFAGQDLEKNSRVTMMMSLAQGSFCKDRGYDPMDPRCARVIFTGTVKKIKHTDAEYETAKSALFTRHVALSHTPKRFDYYFAKLEIETIVVYTQFGYPQSIDAKEYYYIDKNNINPYARRYK